MLFTGIVNAQNVGVGTIMPGAKLDVNGTLKVTDGTQGDGKILTSDAAGLASWQAPPATTTEYPSVWIGCNSWMIKNLDVSTYRNGDPIPNVTSNSEWFNLTTGAYCYYNHDSATYAATYGKLYNWYAVNDPRGLAPEGWHVPSKNDWTDLTTALGGEAVAGGFTKETSTIHWPSPNSATNTTNFTGLPGGYRLGSGGFFEIGNFGEWWSSSDSGAGVAWSQFEYYAEDGLYSDGANKRFGFSVRCVRD